MKILVLGCARTATSALCQSLKIKNEPIRLLQEKINIDFDSKIKLFANLYKDKKVFESKVREHVIKEHEMYAKSNLSYIVKCLGHHFTGMGSLIKDIFPHLYDEIHLIERKNLWHQICSHQVSDSENYWLANQNKPHTVQKQKEIIEKRFTVTKEIVERTAWDLSNYVQMKKYLIDNGLDYFQHYYEDEEFQQIEIGPYLKNPFDYSQLIKNYSIGNDVVNLMKQYINKEELTYQYGEFCNQLNKSTIFVSDKVT